MLSGRRRWPSLKQMTNLVVTLRELRATMHSAEWYVKTRNGIRGPFSTTALKRAAANGRLRRTSLVRSSDADKWIAASKVHEFFCTEPPASVSPSREHVAIISTFGVLFFLLFSGAIAWSSYWLATIL
jgi:GYF domain 2